MRHLAITLLGALLATCTAAGVQTGATDLRSNDALIAAIEGPQSNRDGDLVALTLEDAMKKIGVPGASIAVIKDFDIQWSRGYGVADVTTGAKTTPDTLFQAASISKPITAMAVLKAVQDGRFTLDQNVNELLTSWKIPASEATARQPVTLRGLLSHTSGTDDGFGFPGYNPGAPVPTPVQILNGEKPSNVGAVRMARPPLTAYKYSGGGLTLVQLLLTDVLKRPFPDILRETVLTPLGMTHSAYEQPLSPERDRQAARGHDRTGAARDVKWHVYPELAAAGLWTTAPDLARFGIELQKSLQGKSNKVLTRAHRAGNGHAGRRGTVRDRHGHPKHRRGLVPRARRIELGLPVRRARAQAERLRLCRDDQQRFRRPPRRRAPAARGRRLQVGHARQAAAALTWS